MPSVSVSIHESLRIENVRGIFFLSIVGSVLNFIFFFLDYAMYPDHGILFTAMRISIQVLGAIYLAMSYWLPDFVKRHDQLLLFCLGVWVISAIQVMVFLREGYSSPYYAGITLSSIAVGMLTYMNNRTLAVFIVAVVGPYVVPGLFGWVEIERPALFLNNVVFILATLFIMVVAMRLRFELAQKDKAINILQKSLTAAQQERDGPFSRQVLNDVYYVERIIGHGGMGDVYSGHHLRTHRRVAIKLLHPHMVERREVIDRFRREAQIAAQLQSDNIVEVIDVDEQDGQPFIVMELLLGESLASYLQRRPPLELDEVADLVAQIARGLEVAHAAQVVHRDLKPTNVFLQRNEGTNKVKLVDFGISKIQGATAELTRQCSLLGTPSFMSPEQATNMKTDARTDIFALGALAYAMLTGQHPFAGDSIPSVLYAVCQARPVSLRQYRDDITPAIESVIKLSLAKKPSARYQSVAELARDFQAAVAGALDESVIERATRVDWGEFEAALPLDQARQDVNTLEATEADTECRERKRPSR
jgi:tRNA A-37 threonylcarbamoyl transferase component Bud32